MAYISGTSVPARGLEVGVKTVWKRDEGSKVLKKPLEVVLFLLSWIHKA